MPAHPRAADDVGAFVEPAQERGNLLGRVLQVGIERHHDVAALGLGFALFLGLRRLFVGPEVEGVFTLFAILFFFVGLQILALGMIGEYVGRIYQEVRRRPRYVVSEILS